MPLKLLQKKLIPIDTTLKNSGWLQLKLLQKNGGSPMTSAAALEAALEANEGVETDRGAPVTAVQLQ